MKGAPSAAPQPDAEAVRGLEWQGSRWVVHVVGQGVTGAVQDPGAPLLHLVFAREAQPDEPLREIFAVARALDLISDPELEALMERAHPFRKAEAPDRSRADSRGTRRRR